MTDGIQRRLAAILAADVVGYSRLMGEDEAGHVGGQDRCQSALNAVGHGGVAVSRLLGVKRV